MTLTGINQTLTKAMSKKIAKKMYVSAIASAFFSSLYAAPALSFTQDEQIGDTQPEVIEVIGKRNQANSEMT